MEAILPVPSQRGLNALLGTQKGPALGWGRDSNRVHSEHSRAAGERPSRHGEGSGEGAARRTEEASRERMAVVRDDSRAHAQYLQISATAEPIPWAIPHTGE